MLRTHAQTAGCSLTAQQPVNNVVRVAIQALAGVLGGVQSLHTNSMDETLAFAERERAMVALRTQQIIAEESGVTNTSTRSAAVGRSRRSPTASRPRPRTTSSRSTAWAACARHRARFPQKEIAEAAYHFQQQFDRREKVMVGVNRYQTNDKPTIDILRIHAEVESTQVARVRAFKAARDQARVASRLATCGRLVVTAPTSCRC